MNWRLLLARSQRGTGALTRRMIVVAAIWISVLLSVGGFALDRVLASAITRNFDAQLEYVLTALIASAEIGPDGEVFLNRAPADQRFLEPYSGLYFQISGEAADPETWFRSRSLWDRRFEMGQPHSDFEIHTYDSDQFTTESLRVVERDVRVPGSPVPWRFQVAQTRPGLEAQVRFLPSTMARPLGPPPPRPP